MKNKYLFATVLVAVSLLASCAKEGPNGPTGPAGPSFTGTITGHVTLYDQYGSLTDTGAILTKVLLSLSSLSGLILNTPNTNPDINGLYTYTYSNSNNDIATGNYSLAASDSAYAYTVINNFTYLSGTLNLDVKMSAIPVFYSAGFFVDTTNAQFDSLVISISPDPRPRNCLILANSAVPANDTTTPPQYALAYVVPVAANQSTVTKLIPAQDFIDIGISRGVMVYFTEYSYVVNDASLFEDPTSGKKVYYAISNPRIDSARVP